MLVREPAPLARLAGELGAEGDELRLGRRRALPPHRLDEQPQVEVAERWRLVRDTDGHTPDLSAASSRIGRPRSRG